MSGQFEITTSLSIAGIYRIIRQKQKDALRKVLPFFSLISDIDLSVVNWGRLQYHRNNRTYEMLMNICYLLWQCLLPTTDQGKTRFSLFDEESLPKLYEKFILELEKKLSGLENIYNEDTFAILKKKAIENEIKSLKAFIIKVEEYPEFKQPQIYKTFETAMKKAINEFTESIQKELTEEDLENGNRLYIKQKKQFA